MFWITSQLNTNHANRRRTYFVVDEQPHTIPGGQAIDEGWCGTVNGFDKRAHGAFETEDAALNALSEMGVETVETEYGDAYYGA